MEPESTPTQTESTSCRPEFAPPWSAPGSRSESYTWMALTSPSFQQSLSNVLMRRQLPQVERAERCARHVVAPPSTPQPP
eukprot:276449-Prorocentrum_minimum.AAC.1